MFRWRARINGSPCELTLLALRPQSSSSLVPQPQHLQDGGMGQLNISFHGLGRAEASLVLQKGCWRGKLRRRVRNLGGRTLHRHRCLSRTLPPARVSVCLQPSPAAAATNQFHFPDSRLKKLGVSVQNALRVYVQNVLVCTFKTSPVYRHHARMLKHMRGDVENVHTERGDGQRDTHTPTPTHINTHANTHATQEQEKQEKQEKQDACFLSLFIL